MLAHFFLERICKRQGRSAIKLGGDVLRRLEGYRWPGNVRELENIMERLAIFSQSDNVDIKDLPEEILTPPPDDGSAVLRIPSRGISLPELDKQLVITALERNKWNQTHAANFLGISRNVLVYRMQKYHLGPYKNLSSDEGSETISKQNNISITINGALQNPPKN